MSRACCNKCGYKADYITDYNNYEDKGYKTIDEVPYDQMLCGACWELETEVSDENL
jgi:hypothetical protein|tara:strand:+ start:158 stop:325 length:168 start_codon:yes stop_codon:yes gene_type:complete